MLQCVAACLWLREKRRKQRGEPVKVKVIVCERAEKKICYMRADAVVPLRSKRTAHTSEVCLEVQLTELGAIVALLSHEKYRVMAKMGIKGSRYSIIAGANAPI
jgi:hypothetical protein